jgi:hypothetical protein
MAEYEKEQFKFPDELEKETPQVEVEVEPMVEIEVIDDRPEEDQKNSTPLPESIVQDIEDDDLEQYSKEAKQRLLQMKKLINDERRAKEQAVREQQEAVRVAQSLVEKTKTLQSRLTEGEKVYVSNAKEGADRQLDLARLAFKEAYDSGDSDRLMEAQEKLTQAQFKIQQIESYRPQYDENALQTAQNELKIPDRLEICGTKINLSRITCPVYIYASKEDHIVPWQTAYLTNQLLPGEKRFVLGASGHIAGVINPPQKKKRTYWINPPGYTIQ